MGHVTLTIAEIRRPAEGKDRGNIIATNGAKLGCFREKLGLFEIGNTYEIEHSDGDYKNVKSAKLIAAGPQAAPQAAAPHAPFEKTSGGNGHYRPTSPEDAERMFVCATLTALIRAGEVKNDKAQLFHTTQMLRLLWQHTFGVPSIKGVGGGTFLPGEAGQRARA